VHIDDLVDPGELASAVEAGLVRQQTDSDGMLIHNYTEQAMYTNTWTPVTSTCRGLITDPFGYVMARPWPKFFNYGQHPVGSLDLAAPVEVTDKADGSSDLFQGNPVLQGREESDPCGAGQG
jgi:RNA ligase